MKKLKISKQWLCYCLVVILPFLISATPKGQNLERMLGDLEFVKNVLEVKYAPKSWKEKEHHWNLDFEIETAKAKLASLNNPSVKDFQIILKQFFNSLKDYHVSVRFLSTERASLPFTVKGAEGKYFIAHIDRNKLPLNTFAVKIGDELIEFDNLPIEKVIDSLKKAEFGNNQPQTDQALAELNLTFRRGELGDVIPKGPISIVCKNKEGKVSKHQLNWEYTPEKIGDNTAKLAAKPKTDVSMLCNADPSFLKENQSFFQKFMVNPSWEKSLCSIAFEEEENRYILGSKKSYIPSLGKKLWQSPADFSFDAYIYTHESQKRIGYIRIPHYMADEAEAEEFRQIIDFFKKQTDALVIDQIDNPGGSVFYLYALASMLTDKPLYTPKHRLALTQEEVYTAVSLLPVLEMVKTEEIAQSLFGETLAGYPITMEFVRLMTDFCEFIIREWNQGNVVTKPFYIFGVNEVEPHPQTQYTKPILVLLNSLDFSGGDFFPAIMQDNKRARLLGTRTAGAGGYVLKTQFPNRMGIKEFNITGSIAERINQKPIENLGVTPDQHYSMTPNDLQNNYVGYVKVINDALKSMIN